jgi:hypothetical protein
VRELLQEEILEAGEPLEDPVPSRGVTYEAFVDEDGSIVVSTGERFSSPSGAAKHFHKRAVNGWKRWRVPRLGGSRRTERQNTLSVTVTHQLHELPRSVRNRQDCSCQVLCSTGFGSSIRAGGEAPTISAPK